MVRWPIMMGEEYLPLQGMDLKLVMTDPLKKKHDVKFATEGYNVLIPFPVSMQKHNGIYKFTLYRNFGKAGQTRVDSCGYVEIVEDTCMENDARNGLDTDTVELPVGNMEVGVSGPRGATFVPHWEGSVLHFTNDAGLENPQPQDLRGPKGDPMTVEDLSPENIAELQKPAIEAASKVQQTEQAVKNAEALRASAEEHRAQAELLRASDEASRTEAENTRETSEAERVSAEQQRASTESTRSEQERSRQSAEELRSGAETLRVSAEASRNEAEGLRVNNENARKSAEEARVSNDKERTSAESLRADAEVLRVEAEKGRSAAEGQRVTKESQRESAESARSSKETARQKAETQRAKTESGRVQSESVRSEAERVRGENESLRQQNETSRSDAEALRASAEEQRAAEHASLKSESEAAILSANTAAKNAETAVAGIDGKIMNKVDKVPGRQLSEENYTLEEKQLLASLNTQMGDVSTLLDTLNGEVV